VIIWRGLGILIVVFGAAFFFGMQYGLQYLGMSSLYQEEIWPLLVVLGLTALVAVILDPQGNRDASLLFIPARFWGFIVIPLVAIVLTAGHYTNAWTLDEFWEVVSTGEVQSKTGLPTGLRNWKDKEGRTMTARLMELEGETAVMAKGDGRKYEVPIRSLSIEDQEFIARLVAKRGRTE